MYLGIKVFSNSLDEQIIADIVSGVHTGKSLGMLNNQYGIIEDENGGVMYCFKNKNDKITMIPYPTVSSKYGGTIKPRNNEQYCAIDLLLDQSCPVKVLTGVYGSGKDYLMINAALQLIEEGKYDKLFYVRNNIEVKDTVPLGALPGEKGDKLQPFLMPLADHVGGLEGLELMVRYGKVEAEHLGYLRGRSLERCIVLSSEAENLTKEHVQLLLGRIGEGSALWLNGDSRQTDKAVFARNSGLEKIVERLQGNEYFGYVHLPKTERSKVAALADLLD